MERTGERGWVADGYQFGFGAAIAFGVASGATFVEWNPARWFFFIAGVTFGLFIVIAFLAHLVGHLFDKIMLLYEQILRIEAEYARQPEPVAEPAAQTEPLKRGDFAPHAFVDFIWDWRERTGVFPTVDNCVHGHDGWRRAMVQEWFQQMVNAGAIVNRIPYQAAGDPAPEWSRARFEQAADAANTAGDII